MLFFVLAPVSFPRYSNGLNGRGKKGWWKRKTMLKYVKNDAVHKRIAGGWDAALTGSRLSNKFLFIITEDADFSHKNYTVRKCKATMCAFLSSHRKKQRITTGNHLFLLLPVAELPWPAVVLHVWLHVILEEATVRHCHYSILSHSLGAQRGAPDQPQSAGYSWF